MVFIYPTYLWPYSSFFIKLLAQMMCILSFTSSPSPSPGTASPAFGCCRVRHTSIGLVPKGSTEMRFIDSWPEQLWRDIPVYPLSHVWVMEIFKTPSSHKRAFVKSCALLRFSVRSCLLVLSSQSSLKCL